MTYRKGEEIKFRNGDRMLSGIVENVVDNLAIDTDDESKATHVLVNGAEFSGYVHISNIIDKENN